LSVWLAGTPAPPVEIQFHLITNFTTVPNLWVGTSRWLVRAHNAGATGE
jgi:hypothetical protein